MSVEAAILHVVAQWTYYIDHSPKVVRKNTFYARYNEKKWIWSEQHRGAEYGHHEISVNELKKLKEERNGEETV